MQRNKNRPLTLRRCEPTTHLPGSPEKIAVMIRRFRIGQELHHESDVRLPLTKAASYSTRFSTLTEWERQIHYDYHIGRRDEIRAERFAAVNKFDAEKTLETHGSDQNTIPPGRFESSDN